MPLIQPPDPAELPGKKLRNWGKRLIAYVTSVGAVAGTNTTITESAQGRAVNAAGGGAGGGSGGAGTQSLYFIDGGVLKTGDFAVDNIADV